MSEVEINGEKLKGCLAEDQSGGLERASEDEILTKGKIALREVVAGATEAGEVAATVLVAMRHPDYFADRYIQSPNYSAGGNSGKVLVIHTVQGSYESCVNWFQNRAAQVSAHYVVGYEGETTQMVSEYDRGWHVGWENGYTIGIEHAGFIDDGYPPTEKCYHASARLAAGIKRRHPGIRIAFSSTSGICGHRNLPNQSHTDPGNEWDMKKYLALVDRYYRGGTKLKPDTIFRVQSGAFSNRSNADTLAKRLKAKGFDTYIVKEGRLHKVQLGAFGNIANARKLVATLKGKGFEAIVKSGKVDDGQGGGGDMPDGSTHKGHRWQGWQPPKEPKASGSYIDRAPTRWHTHWDERVADLAKQIEQKWPGVSCLTYIPGHPLEDWAIANRQHEVSMDVWWKYRGNPLPWEIHDEIWRWLMNDQPLPIRYLLTGGDNLNREWDWLWERGVGWRKYYSEYWHGGHPHVTFAIGPRAAN